MTLCQAIFGILGFLFFVIISLGVIVYVKDLEEGTKEGTAKEEIV